MLLDLSKPGIVELAKIGAPALGYITVAENLPFEIKRVYWTYYTPHDVIRGNHAHKKLRQIIFSICGVINFELEDVKGIRTRFELNTPEKGLYIPEMHWRTMRFSHNAVLLCLASEVYREEDYIRSYDEFKALRNIT
jgi:dTDP-4-dehydrorhamnose 3,5-epimerase-like enzyme